MKTLGILTNGGDTCALNASIKSIRDSAYSAGYKKIYGIHRGYQGLFDGWIEDITRKEIDPRIGGSCLGSLRVSPTRKVESRDNVYELDEKLCKKMVKCLAEYRIDVLVVIGGDGTLQATKMFQEWANSPAQKLYRFNIIGFLKTIDNDIHTTTGFQGLDVSLCPGFPSAVKKIVSCAEGLRVTARTAERVISIETMGRDAGWLAASAAFGGAEILLVPEHLKLPGLWDPSRANCGSDGLSDQELADRVFIALVDEIVYSYTKNRNVLISVAEGFHVDTPDLRKFTKILKGLYGTRKQVGATEQVTILVSPVLDYYFACLIALRRICLRVQSTQILTDCGFNDLTTTDPEQIKECYEKIMQTWIDPVMNAVKSGDGLVTEHEAKAIAEARANWEKYIKGARSEKDEPVAKTDKGGKVAKTVQEDENTQTPPRVPLHPLRDWSIREKLLAVFQLFASDCGCAMPPLAAPYNFEIRPHRTDYTPRSGPPSAYDYRLATMLGRKVGQMLLMGEYGNVPVLEEAVPYDKLTLEVVKTVSIDLIRTQNFEKPYYFGEGRPLQVSGRITDFFRTISGGPEDLEQAIREIE